MEIEKLLKEKNIDLFYYTYNKETKTFENKYYNSSTIISSLVTVTNFLSSMNIKFEVLENYSIKIIE